MNSMNIWAGGDVVFAKFNRGKSEYALNYTVAFQDSKTIAGIVPGVSILVLFH